MRTKRSAAKRFKKTATGKFKRNQAYHGHELSKMGPSRGNSLAGTAMVSKADTAMVKKLLPYA